MVGVVPIRRVGAELNGLTKDALMSIRESLTDGSRCFNCPRSQAASICSDATGSNRSAGSDANTAAPIVCVRNLRRSTWISRGANRLAPPLDAGLLYGDFARPFDRFFGGVTCPSEAVFSS